MENETDATSTQTFGNTTTVSGVEDADNITVPIIIVVFFLVIPLIISGFVCFLKRRGKSRKDITDAGIMRNISTLGNHYEVSSLLSINDVGRKNSVKSVDTNYNQHTVEELESCLTKEEAYGEKLRFSKYIDAVSETSVRDASLQHKKDEVKVQTSTNKPLEDEDNDEGVDLTDGDLNVTHLDTRLGLSSQYLEVVAPMAGGESNPGSRPQSAFFRSETPETVLEEQEPESPEHNGIKGLIEDLHGHRGQDHPDGDLKVSEESSDSTSRPPSITLTPASPRQEDDITDTSTPIRQSHSTQDEADFSPRLSILPELEPHALPEGRSLDRRDRRSGVETDKRGTEDQWFEAPYRPYSQIITNSNNYQSGLQGAHSDIQISGGMAKSAMYKSESHLLTSKKSQKRRVPPVPPKLVPLLPPKQAINKSSQDMDKITKDIIRSSVDLLDKSFDPEDYDLPAGVKEVETEDYDDPPLSHLQVSYEQEDYDEPNHSFTSHQSDRYYYTPRKEYDEDYEDDDDDAFLSPASTQEANANASSNNNLASNENGNQMVHRRTLEENGNYLQDDYDEPQIRH